jgi:hypothetical protein
MELLFSKKRKKMELLHATTPAASFSVSTPLIDPHPSLLLENVLHDACLIGR